MWLIVAAFFIAEGFLITGLGRRIALMFVTRLGRSTLGLSYGMALTDLILAPATPSNTARCGGVVFPIVASLSHLEDSHPEPEESRKRLGAYLTLTALQVNVITSAMFVTAMAGNPVAPGGCGKAGSRNLLGQVGAGGDSPRRGEPGGSALGDVQGVSADGHQDP